ncbi:homeobox protein ceh-31-like isoform X2 [Bicyclus anynana]|uniref:Homeobox protein ceh-31-like isoform X2 n=1 Tax=Bicyclus anynana TaxID=110368 RepID=A0A6J1P8D8_BICAN|nr:homeobox protein ceh-31-like isoform X2 [Bicyclus anynana]
MLHLNRFQLGYPNESFVQFENMGFIPEHGFTQPCQEEDTVVFNDSSCLVYQNAIVQGWINNCEVLGFIPDCPSPDYPATDCFNYSVYNQKQTSHARSFHGLHSSPPKRNALRVNLKRKRKRTIFTTEQIVILEGVFQRKPYISREERLAMMNSLQLSEKAIKIWFQNRRRLTDKKCQEYTSDSPSSQDSQDYSESLTFIEAQIKDNTDENGYVTLNDHAMSELVNVIDDCIPKDLNLNDLEFCRNTNSSRALYPAITEDVVMYEPISPASSDHNVI